MIVGGRKAKNVVGLSLVGGVWRDGQQGVVPLLCELCSLVANTHDMNVLIPLCEYFSGSSVLTTRLVN